MKEHNIQVEFNVREHEILNEALLHLESCFDSVLGMIDFSYDQKHLIMDKRGELCSMRKKMLDLWLDRFERNTDKPI